MVSIVGFNIIAFILLNHYFPFNTFTIFVFLPLSGIGSEICARIMEHETFFHLDAPIWRVTGK